MKKFFAIAFIAATTFTFVACNSGETTPAEDAVDSATATVDSVAQEATQTIDSATAVVDSTAKAVTDSLK